MRSSGPPRSRPPPNTSSACPPASTRMSEMRESCSRRAAPTAGDRPGARAPPSTADPRRADYVYGRSERGGADGQPPPARTSARGPPGHPRPAGGRQRRPNDRDRRRAPDGRSPGVRGELRALRPEPRHETLLHACLDTAEPALAAWRRWRGMVDFDDIDGPESRLLPLAMANLGEAIRDDPDQGRGAGPHPRVWSRNQGLFPPAAHAIGGLQESGIEVMLLKGAALATLYYGSEAERPMADVDILVRPADAARAFDQLGQAGWRCRFSRDHALTRAHSADLADQGHAQL